MNTVERIRSVLQRPLGHVATLLRQREEGLPPEADPVGQFLESKKKGVNPAEDKLNEALPVAAATHQEAGQAVESSGAGTADGERAVVSAEPVEVPLKSPVQPRSKVESSAAVLPESEKEKVGQAEGKVRGAMSETKTEAQALVPSGQKIEAVNAPAASNPKEEEKIESALEIFKSEELALDTTSSLSKELSDMSVYSLLEESKEIAQIAKKAKKEHSQ